MTRPALFLDRDGVINVDHGYVYQRENFDFIPGIFDLCRHARAQGYLLFVITNQAGIARGFYTEADFHALSDWMRSEFEREGCPIDEIYFCPTHPQHGLGEYRRESPRRKPNPGMILDAQAAFDVDLASSILIGDKPGDIAAGLAAGIGCNVLLSPAANEEANPDGPVVHSLGEARRLLRAKPADAVRI